mgnify:CR=1 FL=1
MSVRRGGHGKGSEYLNLRNHKLVASLISELQIGFCCTNYSVAPKKVFVVLTSTQIEFEVLTSTKNLQHLIVRTDIELQIFATLW